MIKLSNLAVRVGDFSLREVSLDIDSGEYFIILGPTGAGKTVLLESIAGLHPVSEGVISVDGRDITKLQPERRGLGMVYQDHVLFPHLSVWENVAFGLRSTGCPRRDVGPRVDKIARLMNIDHLLQRKPPGLSGGERQRVALARALVTEPKVLLLDEPLSALDPQAREKMQRELAEIHRRLNVTIIHVTHDFEEALSLGDRVAVLNKGQVVQVGTPDDIMRRPNSEFVAGFALSRNLFQGNVVGAEDASSVDIGGLQIRAQTVLRGAVHVSIRPEDMFISREPTRSTAGDSFQGKITGVVDRGSVIYVTVSIPPDFTCLVSRQSFSELDLKTGIEVYITIVASAVHVF
jgi:ABC-type Fe3+/spermidine/putrescine transport system ATPase subunit